MRAGLPFANDLSREQVIPAPVGGLNLNDSLANMPPLDAYQMDNVLPGQSFITMRNGYSEHETAVGSATVATLAAYAFGSTEQLIAASAGNLYNVTTAGTTATAVGTGYSSDVWDTIMQRGTLVLVNGSDTPQQYNGTAASDATYTGISTPANLVKVHQYRNRLYFTEKNFLGFYYGNVDSVTGALVQVNLSGVFRNGGFTLWTASFTRDAGDGQDDLFVVASNKNEMLVYEGSFPDDPSWNKIGLYKIPTLLGRNSYQNVGGDLLLLTSSGIMPLSSVMQMGTVVNNNQKVSAKINQAFPDLARNYGTNAGWQMLVYPKGQYMLVNVPISPGTTYWQYVVNLQTGAWGRFLNQQGAAWAIYADGLYFGGVDGRVMLADHGTTDDGDTINFEWRQAYGTFKDSNNKLFNMIQSNITASSDFPLNVDVDVDFANTPYAGALTSQSTSDSAWDTSPWDTTPWAGSFTLSTNWVGLGAYGLYGSIRQRGMVSNTTVSFNTTRVIYEPGGKI